MKKTIFLIIILVMTGISFAQEKKIKESDVPKTVFDSFKAKYPGAISKIWVFGEDNYEVTFNLNSIELEASFSVNGDWIETLKNISKLDLPESVLNSLDSSIYRKWKITETAAAETPDYKLLYMIEVVKKKKSKELYFTPEGMIIKEE